MKNPLNDKMLEQYQERFFEIQKLKTKLKSYKFFGAVAFIFIVITLLICLAFINQNIELKSLVDTYQNISSQALEGYNQSLTGWVGCEASKLNLTSEQYLKEINK